jgi:Tol biopolymer transport system component
VKIFSNAAGSPSFLALNGTATAAAVTTGLLDVEATLNGQPYSGDMSFSVTDPGGTIDYGAVPLIRPNQGVGAYSVASMGENPGAGTLVSVTPSNTQTLSAGRAVVFTFNFTAPLEFTFSCPAASTAGATSLMIAPPGMSASVTFASSIVEGGAQTIGLTVSGLPAGASASFSPQSLPLSAAGPSSSTFSVTPALSTPPGLYRLVFQATNAAGVSHTLSGILVVSANGNPALVSVGIAGAGANGFNDFPAISADGRYVAFLSQATNLVPGDTNGAGDIFVRDLQMGTTTLVSFSDDFSPGDDVSTQPSINQDGRFVAFRSVAGNLVPNGRHGFGDIYVRDLQLGRTVQVNLSSTGAPSDGGAFNPSISGDGRFVAFTTNSSNLVTGGGGGVPQVYLRDIQAGTTSLVSASNDGTPGNAAAQIPMLSGDGLFVAFVSSASNLVPGGGGPSPQVYLRDVRAGTTRLVSGAPDGSLPNEPASVDGEEHLAVSADGRYVAFTSLASNLTTGDDNAASDVFVWDRVAGTTTVASVTNDGAFPYSGGAAPAIRPIRRVSPLPRRNDPAADRRARPGLPADHPLQHRRGRPAGLGRQRNHGAQCRRAGAGLLVECPEPRAGRRQRPAGHLRRQPALLRSRICPHAGDGAGFASGWRRGGRYGNPQRPGAGRRRHGRNL